MTIRELLRAAGRVLQPRLTALEKRIEELEKFPFVYVGTHRDGNDYRPGEFVTHKGSLWHCDTPTTNRPGDGLGWTLAVKHGRDLRNDC